MYLDFFNITLKVKGKRCEYSHDIPKLFLDGWNTLLNAQFLWQGPSEEYSDVWQGPSEEYPEIW